MKGLKRSRNIYVRGKYLWIDYQEDCVRIRKSTGIKNSTLGFKFVKDNYERFLNDKERKKAKIDYYKLEDEHVTKSIEKKERDYELKLQSKKTSLDSIIDKDNNAYSFTYAMKFFLKEKQFLKKSSLEVYNALIKLIYEFLKSKNIYYIYDFKREDSIDFMSYLLEKNLSKSYIKISSMIFNRLFNIAIENCVIDKNPFFTPKVKEEKEKRLLNPFSLDEVKLLIENSDGILKSYLTIAFFTGARTGEILALTWKDIDFHNKEISITKSLSSKNRLDTPKTKSSYRVIDMLEIVEKELLSMKQTNLDDFIFKISRKRLKKMLDLLLDNLNIQERTLYETRHTFASVMLSKGEEPMWVGCKMLGHKDLNETYKSYAKYLPKSVTNRAVFLKDYFQ